MRYTKINLKPALLTQRPIMSFRPQGEIFDRKAKLALPEIFDLQWLFKAEPGRFLLVPANVSRSAK
jgi:hypothetical protein